MEIILDQKIDRINHKEDTDDEEDTKLEVNSDLEIADDTKWDVQHEKILISWSDNAMVYHWLHTREYKNYWLKNIWFTIPVIIISTITGTANFAISRIPTDYKQYAEMGIGAFNLFVGILSTIKQFLKIAELNEAHRVAALAWNKYHRNIKVEVTKSPEERMPVKQMLKICKEEYDRLIETSPDIRDKSIKQFKNKFKKNKEYNAISKPEICDVLISTSKFKYVYTEPKVNNYELIHRKQNEMKKKNQENEKKLALIKQFINQFKNVRGRYPFKEEILENLSKEISEKQMLNIIEKNKLNITEH